MTAATCFVILLHLLISVKLETTAQCSKWQNIQHECKVQWSVGCEGSAGGCSDTLYCLLYLCHKARRLSKVACFSAAFPTNSPCCFWRLVTSSSSWLPSPSLFMAEHRAISLGFSCSTAWQTSWKKRETYLSSSQQRMLNHNGYKIKINS